VAAFRSIETRLPQFRVTANGISAAIDPAGTLVATTAIGEPALLTVAMPIRTPARTLMVAWGNWVGAAALAALLVLAACALWRRLRMRSRTSALEASQASSLPDRIDVALLSPVLRALLAVLQLVTWATLAWIALRMLSRDGLRVHSLAQLTWFAFGVILPALCGRWIRRRYTASMQVDAEVLRLVRNGQARVVPIREIVAITPWLVPMPTPGLSLRLASGTSLAVATGWRDPSQVISMLQQAGAPAITPTRSEALALAAARARAEAPRWRIDHPWFKFGLFPLLLALPAFRLHQHIAYGGTFGEYYSFGLLAWLLGLLIWWASWSIGMTLFGAVLRILVELGSLAALLLRPRHASGSRSLLQGAARALYFVGAPAWLGWRLLAG
jgi:apolipoprotein N-acyltransferase